MKHDRATTIAAPGVLKNDLDLVGGTTAIKTGDPTHGTVVLRANGGFTYTPDAGYLGSDVFRYRPSGLLGVATTVTITVTNAAPVAANDTYTATTGVQLSVGAPGILGNDNDADGDSLSAVSIDESGNGSLSVSSNGSFTFKSGGSFVGPRTFTYRASDGIASSATRTVTINVRAPAPTPPPPPPPTPAPTPAPTPRPTPAPTPRPTPTPIIPLPTLPLPSIPLPSISIPPLPLPTPTPRPTGAPGPTATPRPTGGSASPTPTAAPSGAVTSPSPGSTPGGVVDPTATPASGGGSGVPGASGGPPPSPGGGSTPDDPEFAVGRGGLDPIDGLIAINVVGFDGLIEWAVPAIVLSVPGLLLLLAVLAQAAGGLLWLPVVRRWLGGFGFGKRRTRAEETG